MRFTMLAAMNAATFGYANKVLVHIAFQRLKFSQTLTLQLMVSD